MSRRLSLTLIGLLAFVLAALGLYWLLSTLCQTRQSRRPADSQSEREPGAGEAGEESEAESAAPAQDDSVQDGESPRWVMPFWTIRISPKLYLKIRAALPCGERLEEGSGDAVAPEQVPTARPEAPDEAAMERLTQRIA